MRVYLLDAARTPFRRIFTGFEKFTCLELSTILLNFFFQHRCAALQIDAFYFGSVLLDPEFPNLAREIVLRSNLAKTIPAHFISNYCITSLSACEMAFRAIKSGSINCAVFGGVEVMSRTKLFLSQKASDKFNQLGRAKNFWQKAKQALKFSFSDFKPMIPSPREPSTGLTMGESCEVMNLEYQIPRLEQDKLALRSHQRAFAAKDLVKGEIVPIDGISEDNLIRSDTSLEKLGNLRPVFSSSGTLTAGNSSPLTDGAALGVLVSEKLVDKAKLEPLAEILDIQFAAIDLSDGLLMAPVVAIEKLATQNGIAASDIDVFEMHEAFACQVLCNLARLTQGWPKYNVSPRSFNCDFNQWGGSLAYGHPFAATGVRLLSFAARQLKMLNKKFALVSSCAAGGGGAAALLKAI